MQPELIETKNKRQVIFRSDEFEIIAIEWASTNISEMHDHGVSQCVVLIKSGSFENTLCHGSKTTHEIVNSGDIVNTPLGASHKMICLTPTAKTLHIYTPPLDPE